MLDSLSFRCALQDVQAAGRIAGDALQIMAETAFEPSLMDFPPSLVAAATLYVARKKVGSSPFWPNALAQLTGTACPESSHSKLIIQEPHDPMPAFDCVDAVGSHIVVQHAEVC